MGKEILVFQMICTSMFEAEMSDSNLNLPAYKTVS